MDPKVILMPVYTRGNEIERLRGALSVTKLFSAHLDVLHAQAKPSDMLERAPFGISPAAQERLRSIMDEEILNEQQELRYHFKELCDEKGIEITDQVIADKPTAHWREIDGARSELVAQQGRISDLIIIPHSKSGKASMTFQEAVMHTGRPVLLVPRGLYEVTCEHILIGWNGSLEATRAVSHAMPFLKRAKTITILGSADEKAAKPDAAHLKDYLTYHGVDAAINAFDEKTHSPGQALLQVADHKKCDFLVTGAYTHTRLRQRILGGTTQHLLEYADIPVLMTH